MKPLTRFTIPWLAVAFAGWVGLFGWTTAQSSQGKDSSMIEDKVSAKKATFAGGCFWCVESDFDKVDGVIEAISGYTGGHAENPTYEQVCAGNTGHMEAVEVHYDPARVSYPQLLDVFWRHVDPTDPEGQFVDRGSQYRTAVFYHDDEQKRLAEASRKELEASGRFDQPITTPILKAGPFYRAEDYHQDYHKKQALRYQAYRRSSGRDAFLKEAWSKECRTSCPKPDSNAVSAPYVRPTDGEIRRMLTPLQHDVTQNDGTERPFHNEYWDNKREGIYVDVVSGEPLFSSEDKFDSGTGWPSFSRPLVPEHIVEKEDRSLFNVRTEVRSKHADSHLGHVFPDGPPPKGLRYCINSAALRFISREDLEKEGYGRFEDHFDRD